MASLVNISTYEQVQSATDILRAANNPQIHLFRAILSLIVGVASPILLKGKESVKKVVGLGAVVGGITGFTTTLTMPVGNKSVIDFLGSEGAGEILAKIAVVAVATGVTFGALGSLLGRKIKVVFDEEHSKKKS